jgi:hypothetical protein
MQKFTYDHVTNPELKEWLELRRRALDFKRKASENGGPHFMLMESVICEEQLPEPMRSEAIEILKPEYEQHEKELAASNGGKGVWF